MQTQDNAPRRGRPAREVHTDDMQLAQKDDLIVDPEGDIDRGAGLALMTDDQLRDENYMRELAFNEEPVTIIINAQSRADSPMTHIPCWVQGKAAEVWVEGRWISAGWLPIETELTVKRKYVEVLARAKPEDVTTHHSDRPDAGVPVVIRRHAVSAYPMTIINDSAEGVRWMQNIKINH